ncbi:MAG TPA: hypothetical protein VGP93_13460 [Polyangiaceae bacterium]|nr:hypothetical protein [Polyangiaceae bacterium]
MTAIRIPVGQARKQMASMLRRAQKGAKFKLTRYNRTLAGLVSREDLLLLEECKRTLGRRRAGRARTVGRRGRALGR